MEILIAIWLQKHYWEIIEWMDIEDIEWIINRISNDWYDYAWAYTYISEWLPTIDMKEYF